MGAAFTKLGLAPKLPAAIAELGYETPTAIQARTIPAPAGQREAGYARERGPSAPAEPRGARTTQAPKRPRGMTRREARRLRDVDGDGLH